MLKTNYDFRNSGMEYFAFNVFHNYVMEFYEFDDFRNSGMTCLFFLDFRNSCVKFYEFYDFHDSVMEL